eukprot:TRINITY_DN22734_c0_g1_i1.p1 TRINITY_DN22734_c0_g1~~TRINITY_DN22734_c0_g1_i1.p1  ORF type:complete len:325 (-),score=65.69 TRINITY_DN22734_c0_g1_i1:93-956(-)
MTSVSIVTGAGRNPGIGYEIVRGLAQRLGGYVVLTARDASQGEAAAEALRAEGFAGVTFHPLDVTDKASIESLRKFVKEQFDGVDFLINNAGLAFPLESDVPFSEQARQSMDVNYYGTKRMIDAFLPLLRPGGRVVGISSSSGKLGSSWSAARRDELLAEALTLERLDAVAEEFVAAAQLGRHRAEGFPGTAYGTSKALMTQLHRVYARRIRPPQLIAAVCPGLCRTHMATGRGTWMSNVLWAASFIVGHSAAGGADTPIWLCCDLQCQDVAEFNGRFVSGRKVQTY